MSNLNDVKTKVTRITLCDGVEREVKFTLNAMAEMEERYGSVDACFEALNNNSIKAVRFVIWAGLLHNEHENLTEKQVGNLIDVPCMERIMESLTGAFENDMPATGNELPNVKALPVT
jgi:hypothetical protein